MSVTPRPSSAPGEPGSTLSGAGEFSVIAAITEGRPQPAGTLIGPGDDAAAVAADGQVLATVDVLVDGVHFRSDWATGEQIGRRAALAAMADIAAMGARPTALLVGLAAPADTAVGLVTAIGDGLQDAAREHGAGLVGGDLTAAPVLMISVTVLGDPGPHTPVLRSGARAGDVIAVTGRLGWAAAGLAVLSRGFRSPAAVVSAYKVPEPPLAQGPIAAAAGATSMIDVSDGLLAEAAHLAAESGVSIDVRRSAFDLPEPLHAVGAALTIDPVSLVLGGGEDHSLLATFPADASLPDGWTVIGEVREASQVQVGLVTVDGAPYDGPTGWTHF